MKTWENATIEALNVDKTENGGEPTTVFDQTWFDENGAAHVNFPS